jgi:hypothetical protein
MLSWLRNAKAYADQQRRERRRLARAAAMALLLLLAVAAQAQSPGDVWWSQTEPPAVAAWGLRVNGTPQPTWPRSQVTPQPTAGVYSHALPPLTAGDVLTMTAAPNCFGECAPQYLSDVSAPQVVVNTPTTTPTMSPTNTPSRTATPTVTTTPTNTPAKPQPPIVLKCVGLVCSVTLPPGGSLTVNAGTP